jgi:hypothetical protein
MIRKFKGESLFLERERDFSKTAAIKVGKNPAEWPTEIIEMLHEQHPYLAESNIQISMKKTDEDSGAGLGSIVIDDKAMIPLVIENNKVASLDMFYDGDQLFPMTRDRIEAVSRGTSIGKPVTPAKGEVTDSSLVQSVHPPYDGKYTFASDLTYSKKDFSDAISRSFSYQGLVAELSNPIWKEALAAYIGSDKKTVSETTNKPALVKKASSVYTAPKHSGVYEVVTEKGPMVGMFVSQLQKFAEHSGHSGLFINTATGQYSKLTTEEVAAREVNQLPQVKLANLSGKGVFVVPGDKHGVTVTDPIEIKYRDGDHYEAVDEYGRKFTLYKSAEFVNIEVAGRVIGIPERSVFVPLTEQIKLASPNFLDRGGNRLEISRMGDKYFAKTAAEIPTVSELPDDGAYIDEMILALQAHFNVAPIESDLRKLANKSKINLSWTTAPVVEKTAGKTIELSLTEKSALTKVASYFDEKTLRMIKLSQEQGKKTVDALLGLNFVGPENMQRFVDKIETISQARQAVGELLLASRLGLDVDQMPLKTAFQALDKIESELRQLRTMESAV